MKTFNFNPCDLFSALFLFSLFFCFLTRTLCECPYALGCWQFPVFSFTTQIWYDKWRKHGVSIATHLSANESAHTMFNFFHYESLRRVCRHFCLNRRHPSFRLSILFLIFRNIRPVRCNRIYTIVECLSMPPKERKKKQNKNLKNFYSAKFSKKTYLNRIF